MSLAVQLRRLIGGKGPWRGARGGRGAVAQLPGKRLGKGIGRQLSDARVRPHGVVVAPPVLERGPRLGERGEQRVVQELIAPVAIDGMDGPRTR